MKRLAVIIVCGFFCIAKTNLQRQAQRAKTSVKVGGEDLFGIVRDGSDVKLIAALLRGGDVNSTDGKGMSLLHHAAQLGRDDMVKVLHRHGAETNLLNNASHTALQLAQEGKHTKVIELLQDDVKETAVTSNDGGCDNALHVASLGGNIGEVERLLAGGADVNARDGVGRTALHYAALKGDAGVVNLLLANNAELGIQDNFGNTAATAAQFAKQPRIVEVLDEWQESVAKLDSGKELEEQAAVQPEGQTDNEREELRKAALAVRAQNKTCMQSWQN